jgi:hypothetical protein
LPQSFKTFTYIDRLIVEINLVKAERAQ